MNQNFLIATPIISTWPKPKKNTLVFSSESAILNANGPQNKYKNHIITEFRWKNKKKLFEDYEYIDSLYEKLLVDLANKLNSLHSINYSLLFWRILIGPWLSTFLHIYYERWKNIETTCKNNKIDNCIFLNLNNDLFTPYDDQEFCFYSFNDLWNQFIYQYICNYFIKKKIINKKYSLSLQKKEIKKMQLSYKPKKSKFSKFLFSTFDNFNKRNYKYFIYQTYLGFKQELKLSIKLNQMPIFSFKEIKKNNKIIHENFRKDLLSNFKPKDNFEKSLNGILGLQLPLIFVENFSDLEQFSKLSNIPQNPKIIFTSNTAWFDTKVTYHIAKLKEKKTKLLYGQHGGTYGISKILWPEKHEREISDNFLSWGWNENNDPKIINIGIFKKLKINRKKSEKRNLLFMLKSRQRYFYSMDSSGGTEQYSEHIKYCSKFLFKLNKNIKSKTILRLPHNSDDVKNVDFYSNLGKTFDFFSKNSVQDAYNQSKLTIHTINSTSFIETLSANIPSILIMKKKLNPIRDFAKNEIENLYDNKLIFDDSVKAAIFVNSIWSNHIDTWWSNKATQFAIKRFCKIFAKENLNILGDLKKILQ